MSQGTLTAGVELGRNSDKERGAVQDAKHPRPLEQITIAPRGAPIVYLLASVAVLSVAVPATLVSTVDDIGRSDAWMVTCGIAVYGGLRLSALWVRGAASLFDFFFWLYTYIFMGLAATVQLRSGEISTTTPGMDPEWDMPAALTVAGGLIAYELSRYLWRTYRHIHAPRTVNIGVSARRVLLLGGVGVLFSVYYLTKIGFGAAIGSRAAAAAAREAAWADPATRSIFLALAIYPLLVAVGGALVVRRRLTNRLNRSILLAVALLGMVVLLAVVNPVASARYTLGTVIFALVVFFGGTATRIRTRLVMLGTILGFLFLFPIADAFRRDEVRVSQLGFADEYMNNPDYDSFWQVANAFSYWIDGLVQPFQQFLGSILFWVPRALWPDKPIDTGILLAQYRGYTVENLSAPLWAELLVNGGILAVVVGCVLLGCLLGSLDRQIASAARQGDWWLLPQAILPVYMTIFMRGSWLQATGAIVVVLACVAFVASRHAAPASEVPAETLAPEAAVDP